jgi:hypothetical protein
VALVLLELWEADALRALLSLWRGAAVPELGADPDDDELDVPDEPPADPELMLGDDDPAERLVDDPDELDDPPDPELAYGDAYRTGVAPPPDPECPVEGPLVCSCRWAVCACRRVEARCLEFASSGGIAGAGAKTGCSSRALGDVLAVLREIAEPPGDDVRTLAPINAATPAMAMTPAAAVSRPHCAEDSARRCQSAARCAIARARFVPRDGSVSDGGSVGSVGGGGSTLSRARGRASMSSRADGRASMSSRADGRASTSLGAGGAGAGPCRTSWTASARSPQKSAALGGMVGCSVSARSCRLSGPSAV